MIIKINQYFKLWAELNSTDILWRDHKYLQLFRATILKRRFDVPAVASFAVNTAPFPVRRRRSNRWFLAGIIALNDHSSSCDTSVCSLLLFFGSKVFCSRETHGWNFKFVQYQVADMRMSPVTAALTRLVVFSAMVMFVDYGLTESLSTEG